MGIQQMLLGLGAKKKTYVDDVCRIDRYDANQGNYITVNNGIDLAGKGGLVWGKRRDYGEDHVLCDTERGTLKYLASNSNAAPVTDHGFSSYNSNGFTVNNASRGAVNQSSGNYVTSTFRKAPGFFDVVTYTGSGSTQQIAHNLGSIPGCYMIKCSSHGGSWMVYHHQLNSGVNAEEYRLQLDATANQQDDNVFGDTAPTATHFTAGSSHAETNQSGRSYVCYLFAGGESTASEAVSVNFNGTSQYLSIPDSTDYEFGSGDFTVEAYINHSTDDFHNEEGIVCKHYGGYSSWRLVTAGSGAASTLKFIWMDSNGNENTVT